MSAPPESLINEVYAHVRISEGINALHDFLTNAYLREGQSVKELASRLFLPVPVVSAVKNELKRHGLLLVKSGIYLTETGSQLVKEELGYENVNRDRLLSILDAPDLPMDDFREEIKALAQWYDHRPSVDVTVDQSLCTAETGIKRALLMLRTGSLIGKRIVCVGDDDLVSIAILLVLKRLTSGVGAPVKKLTVADIDARVLRYISETAQNWGVAVQLLQHDLRAPMPNEYEHQYDTAVTDPPYTLEGLKLFVSRGAQMLKTEPGSRFYLSFARKDPVVRLAMQRSILQSGLVINGIYERFNQYHGAQILGGVSDMLVLEATTETQALYPKYFDGSIYTNEQNRSVRVYVCKHCQSRHRVGHGETVVTIEQLKQSGCVCGGHTFVLRERVKA